MASAHRSPSRARTHARCPHARTAHTMPTHSAPQYEIDFNSNDVTYINKRNEVYNKKIERAFDPYTAEIKANLERGTAL